MLYAGITRGRRLVVLVGQRKALVIAVRSQASRYRWAKLREHILQRDRRVSGGRSVGLQEMGSAAVGGQR
jgi:ATP-dependent exoDNAse (exonuclease V) alpha subunit